MLFLNLSRESFPLIGYDCVPDKPQFPILVDEKNRVDIRETRNIGHQKRFAPGTGAILQSGTHDPDIIGPPLT